MSDFNLKNRTAVVVGGAGSIGAGICRGFAASGARVLVADLEQESCDALASSLEEVSSGPHAGLACDSTTEAGVGAIAKRCVELGGVDVVVHTVGLITNSSLVGYVGKLSEHTLSAWELGLKTNLSSAFLLARGLLPLLEKSEHASMVLLSSIYGSRGPVMELYADTDVDTSIAYGVSKGGLEQLMRYLARMCAPQVRVNCVSPGGIERGQNPKFIEKYKKHTPLGRMAQVDDVVGPVLFLASDSSKYVSGQNLIVDGGWSC